ncbi:hypothetical protein GCM10007301_42690 [Azorhizobium oxalatiphilum]|uniref:Uncharacterized protein n=1 Tax=Azorhizobium oxalatiphilum TaxID=980631 RepID=A0A917FF60_9HYPH|nr:T3SS effector HopA1 family protein [Azorhizobium oxalatiphilum]GGF78168.1 hypothetical protein GCM10007301_42690 [Azorhizobium oxalatiphilum]
MPTAADEYVANLAFFAGLRNLTGTVKLAYSATTGRFSRAGNAFSRTIGNWKATGGQEQSVTNDAMFHDPIVSVFRAARTHNADIAGRRDAYQGLATLRRQYTDQTKAASLQRTLVDVLAFIHSALVTDTLERYRTIDPDAVLGPLDLSFLNTVWDQRARLFPLVEQGAMADAGNRQGVRPYATLANQIYKLYNANAEVEILDKTAWAKALPALHKNKTGQRYYHLQHNRVALGAKDAGQMASNRDYGTDFVYYTPGCQGEGLLWRIYLNFEAEAASAILNHLWSVAKTFRIQSFKISGPHSFHTRVDKIVIYVQVSHLDLLVANLRANAEAFRLKSPSPGMTRPIIPGLSIGVEPGMLNTGFGFDPSFDPRQIERQSYGSIRCQLIAAALTQMHAVGEENPEWAKRYRADKASFLKWVAIAFEGYGKQLRGES